MKVRVPIKVNKVAKDTLQRGQHFLWQVNTQLRRRETPEERSKRLGLDDARLGGRASTAGARAERAGAKRAAVQLRCFDSIYCHLRVFFTLYIVI